MVEGEGLIGLLGYILTFRSDRGHCPQSDTAVGVQYISHQTLDVYPNPTTGDIRIGNINAGTKYSFEIFDTNGKMLDRKHNANGNQITLPSWLPSGLYLLRFTFGDEIKLARVVKI